MELLVIADTHLGAGQEGRLLERVAAELVSADVVLHAGDVTDASVLESLSAAVGSGSMHAVLGNNDVGLHLPERVLTNVAGCEVAMVHDSGLGSQPVAEPASWVAMATCAVQVVRSRALACTEDASDDTSTVMPRVGGHGAGSARSSRSLARSA